MGTGYTSTTPESGTLHPKKRYEVNFNLIAQVTGRSLPHISRILRGKAAPSVALLEELATVFGVPMQDLRAMIRAGEIVNSRPGLLPWWESKKDKQPKNESESV